MHLLQQDNARLQELVGQLQQQQQHVQQQQQQQQEQEQEHAPEKSSQGHASGGASTPSPLLSLQQKEEVLQSKVVTAAEELWQKRKPQLWIVCKLLLALIPADSSQVQSLKAVQVSMCVCARLYM